MAAYLRRCFHERLDWLKSQSWRVPFSRSSSSARRSPFSGFLFSGWHVFPFPPIEVRAGPESAKPCHDIPRTSFGTAQLKTLRGRAERLHRQVYVRFCFELTRRPVGLVPDQPSRGRSGLFQNRSRYRLTKQLPPEHLIDLTQARYLYPRTARYYAKGLLSCVKLLPVGIGNDLGLAVCKQAVDRSNLRLWGVHQATSIAVGQHRRDSLNRIGFVTANHTSWPALNPTGGVLAGKRLLSLRIKQPPEIVEENPRLFCKWNSSERIAAIAYRTKHQPRGQRFKGFSCHRLKLTRCVPRELIPHKSQASHLPTCIPQQLNR